MADKTVRAGETLTFTATSSDSDGDSVEFFLDDTSPEGASIDTQSGVFSWTTSADLAIGKYPVTIWGVDSGPGNPATEMTLMVSVTAVPIITSPAAVTSAQKPVLSWAPVPGATEYEIWVARAPGSSAYHRATVAQASYTPPVEFGIGKFNLWVRASNSLVVGPWSPMYTFVINTGVTPVAIVRSQPTLRPTIAWNSLPSAVKYDVWINDVSRGISQKIRNTNVAGTSFTPTSDLPLGLYRAWIRGIAADGTLGAWSTTAMEFVTMQAPTITQARNSTFDRTPTFGWDALSGATKYEVFIRNQFTGATTLEVRNLTGLTFTPSTAIPDGPYRWWALGQSAQGVRSFWSAPVDIYIGGRPDLVTPKGSTNDKTPTFAWRPVDGAVRYDLFVSLVNSQAQIIRQQNLTGTSYTPSTSLPIGSYRAWIRAVSSTGEMSPWSPAL